MTWQLEGGIDFLNHGSFGATPQAVLDAQSEVRDRMEAEPVRFFQRELEGLMDEARTALARFVGCSDSDLAFVTNATMGVNTVLRSRRFGPGDELLITDHAYNACRTTLDYVAGRSGATVVVAAVPFPVAGPEEVTHSIMAAVTERTRIAVIDHVTSPTALVFPIVDIVAALDALGVDTIVDGAHAPGMVPLDLGAIGAAYYTGNCHKWMCSPKGAGFLHVRGDRQADLVPLAVSHGANSPRTDRSRFRLLFDWVGTADPSAVLAIPTAIDDMGRIYPGGWPELMAANHQLALVARNMLTGGLGVDPPAPDAMLGSMAAVQLPDATGPLVTERDPLEAELFAEGFEVPIVPWRRWPQRLLRVSAQAYNAPDQYQRLATALTDLL